MSPSIVYNNIESGFTCPDMQRVYMNISDADMCVVRARLLQQAYRNLNKRNKLEYFT